MTRQPVVIEGLSELLKQVDSLGDQGRQFKKEVLYDAGKELQKAIKNAAASLDDGEFTRNNELYGTLEENIYLEWDETTGTTYVTTGSAYWAIMLEYGTIYSDAQPFMEKTFRKHRTKLLKMVAKDLKRKMGL